VREAERGRARAEAEAQLLRAGLASAAEEARGQRRGAEERWGEERARLEETIRGLQREAGERAAQARGQAEGREREEAASTTGTTPLLTA